ncbi:hypothetical protein D4764_04G0011570 [Takifugu flavidus]|uniref:Homeodomain-interacting protein kinase 1 n=1 Tax=Takifugu flavidus TaxID=433684 RepID=A0A5C6N9I4_9TELE|nr:hypothetical protein D4764_04G0011570 [Takifugu flavidus]
MGIPYFSVVEHFPLHPREIWARDANPTNDKNEMERRALYDLLKKLFHFDEHQRISPEKALQHDFITMGHLRTVESKDYLKMCEKMNSLAFTEVSADNSNEKRNKKSEISSSQKEAKTLEKEKKPTKEGDIKSFKAKVFKAESSESSEAETSESSEVETIMSLKGKFTKSLEEIDCEPSQKEIIGTLQEKDSNFSEELLCLASNRKSTEGEANKAKHTESQVEEESESSQKEITDTKSTESPVEYIESSQQESSEDSTRDTSCVDTSVDNATSLYAEAQTEGPAAQGTSGDGPDLLQQCIKYFHEGHSYDVIVDMMSSLHGVHISLRSLKSKLNGAGLYRRKDSSSTNGIIRAIRLELRGPGQLFGYRTMWQVLKQKYNLRVKKDRVMNLLQELNPRGCERRARRRLRTDCGTENGIMAAIQCTLRHHHRDHYSGASSHMYGSSTNNQRIESWWSIFRKGR